LFRATSAQRILAFRAFPSQPAVISREVRCSLAVGLAIPLGKPEREGPCFVALQRDPSAGRPVPDDQTCNLTNSPWHRPQSHPYRSTGSRSGEGPRKPARVGCTLDLRDPGHVLGRGPPGYSKAGMSPRLQSLHPAESPYSHSRRYPGVEPMLS
jgi:hypothetical protein